MLKNLNILLFPFSNEMMTIRSAIHKMLVRIANSEDPDLTASSEAMSSLIWDFTVCQGLFGRQIVFKSLEHLPYYIWINLYT